MPDPRDKLYFLEDRMRRLLKVGVTVNCGIRFGKIVQGERKRADEFHLNCIGWMKGTYSDESAIRERFKGLRVSGTNDWFRDSPVMRKYIKALPLKRFEWSHRYSFMGYPRITVPGLEPSWLIDTICPFPPTEEYLRKSQAPRCECDSWYVASAQIFGHECGKPDKRPLW